MTGLGKTVSRLQHFLRQRPMPAAALPSSLLKRMREFGSNPGALTMLYYVPQHYRGPLPLVVVLHGCTQTAAALDHGTGWSELARRSGFSVLFPEQVRANNPKNCFNWFNPTDIARNQGEVLSIRQMIERLAQDFDIDQRRIFITGLSAGGAMAAAMLATYPEVFAGGAIIAGLPYRAAGTVKEAFDAMFKGRRRSPQQWGDLVRSASAHRGPWPRVSIWQGTADTTVVQANAEELVKQWLNVHGLDGVPEAEASGRLRRHAWRGADGRTIVESCLVTGMGHGAPLDASPTSPSKGNPGPFMLDVGISSTYECALSWALTGPVDRRTSPSVAAAYQTASAAAPPPPPAGTTDAGTAITRALRAAGLLR